MSKAVLITDMPELCNVCPIAFREEHMDKNFKICSKKRSEEGGQSGYVDLRKPKPDWCPWVSVSDEDADEIKEVYLDWR